MEVEELLPEKIINKFSPEPNSNCWLWSASTNNAGYGKISWNGKLKLAHRVTYELIKGTIKEGLELDHLCRTPLCVNPDHLEPVTSKENVLRGNGLASVNAKKTHCKRGHEFNQENTLLTKSGKRRCRVCDRETSRRYYYERRGK